MKKRLYCLAFIHRGISLSHLFQRKLKLEDLARLNGAIEDHIYQSWKMTAYRSDDFRKIL